MNFNRKCRKNDIFIEIPQAKKDVPQWGTSFDFYSAGAGSDFIT